MNAIMRASHLLEMSGSLTPKNISSFLISVKVVLH